MHPRHQDAQERLAKLIAQLRACTNVKEGYDFQQELMSRILDVESDRNALSATVKRMRSGKPPQVGAPEPQSGRDPACAETWQLEHDVCERVARQYRCVGDALAWRVFGFRRREIIALCQNDPPGVMAGKAGLIAELARVKQAWEEDGQFAILHDLTNCLRIGDVTLFGNDGSHQTIEIKSNPRRRRSEQLRRIRAAEEAVRDGGLLPGKDRRARLYDLDIPFRAHMDLLQAGTEYAAREGIFAAKVPGVRALLVTDFYGCSAQGWAEDRFQQRLEAKFRMARRRAGLGSDRERNVNATSLDSVSRDPQRVPFAAYPLHPVTCARLIGDLVVFTVETSGLALADSLRAAGFDAEWVRPAGTGDLAPGEVVMEVRATISRPAFGGLTAKLKRTLQMRRSALDRYLVELIEHSTWVHGLRYMLEDYGMEGRPWPTFRDEHQVWV